MELIMRSSSFLLSVLNLRMGCDFLSSVPTCCVGSLAIRVLIWDCSTAPEVVKKSAGVGAKHPAGAGRRRGGREGDRGWKTGGGGCWGGVRWYGGHGPVPLC